MHAISNCSDRDKLRRRREKVKLTLEFLRAEKLGLERNAQSMDPEAFRRRMRLLERLTDWYHDENAQIDNVLTDPERSGLRTPDRSAKQSPVR